MNYLLKTNQTTRFLISICVLFSIFITTACMPKGAVKKISAFSDGVESVTKNTVLAYETIETVYRKLKTEEAVNSYDPVRTNLEQIKIRRFIPEEDWNARKLVIEGLEQYAANLKAVVSDEQLEEFDGKTKALGQQLVSLNEATVQANILKAEMFKASEIRLFTTAINAIGRWFINYKRKKVVRETVDEMQIHVRNVCMLFAAEIGKYPLNSRGRLDTTQDGTLRKILWVFYSDLIEVKNEAFRRNIGNMTETEKRLAKEELFDLKDERDNADKTLDAVAKALTAIPTAHDNIEKAFDENDTTLAGMIAKIFEEGERIKDFYEGLKKD